MALKIIPLTLKEINALVSKFHRHHKPVQGHKFSIGVIDTKNNMVVGACSAGRPVSRGCNPKEVLEVTRLVTDGTKNACSKLYGTAARIGRLMGYHIIQTYILISEPGTSLKAAGWKMDGIVKGRQWKHTDGKERRTDQPTCDKQRWIMLLNRRLYE